MMDSLSRALFAICALLVSASAFATDYKKIIQCENGTVMDQYSVQVPDTQYTMTYYQIVIRGEHALNHFSSYGVAQSQIGADGQPEIVLQGLKEYYKKWEDQGTWWTEYRTSHVTSGGPTDLYSSAGYSPARKTLGVFAAKGFDPETMKRAEYVFNNCYEQ